MAHGRDFGPRLTFLPEDGVGYFPVPASGVYDEAYFNRYQALARTDFGRRLTEHRAALLRRWVGAALGFSRILDVGVGSGAFVEQLEAEGFPAYGFDVNPYAVAWLKAREAFGLPCVTPGWDVMTFWDSLEHMDDPRPTLACCRAWAFVAIPTFTGADHVLRSKHFRKDEHVWYFTRAGFMRFTEGEGFEVLDISASETAMGREDIETFVLRRRP